MKMFPTPNNENFFTHSHFNRTKFSPTKFPASICRVLQPPLYKVACHTHVYSHKQDLSVKLEGYCTWNIKPLPLKVRETLKLNNKTHSRIRTKHTHAMNTTYRSTKIKVSTLPICGNLTLCERKHLTLRRSESFLTILAWKGMVRNWHWMLSYISFILSSTGIKARTVIY